jgi:hypothetical protein
MREIEIKIYGEKGESLGEFTNERGTSYGA